MEKSKKTEKRIAKIGEKLRELRKKAGYQSAEIFSYEKEIPRVQYWRMENGQNVTLASLFKILDIHGISPSDFFKDID